MLESCNKHETPCSSMKSIQHTASVSAVSRSAVGAAGVSRRCLEKEMARTDVHATEVHSREGLIILRHLSPIDDVPKRLEIIGAAILVLEVVGVFPNVAAEERFALHASDSLAHDWIVLI